MIFLLWQTKFYASTDKTVQFLGILQTPVESAATGLVYICQYLELPLDPPATL